ncbi:hypothetical protein HOT99_gp022 [Caulobacter phage CcrBL10]|uniref:Uncharacterized protein n=1 Tax=Caulobacter phage CcrBL10 TaxID=2283269 RepID=A0A385E921_9CAUD|nr:hypothetical protein HOT99_gp022 [Caulobacter phage CcrBL10]AXQ68226.1 hypothetical protein CcrBL10_gp022 [Caulobacter phage CcrBL10]
MNALATLTLQRDFSLNALRGAKGFDYFPVILADPTGWKNLKHFGSRDKHDVAKFETLIDGSKVLIFNGAPVWIEPELALGRSTAPGSALHFLLLGNKGSEAYKVARLEAREGLSQVRWPKGGDLQTAGANFRTVHPWFEFPTGNLSEEGVAHFLNQPDSLSVRFMLPSDIPDLED